MCIICKRIRCLQKLPVKLYYKIRNVSLTVESSTCYVNVSRSAFASILKRAWVTTSVKCILICCLDDCSNVCLKTLAIVRYYISKNTRSSVGPDPSQFHRPQSWCSHMKRSLWESGFNYGAARHLLRELQYEGVRTVTL
jgi:hypothetical protein